MYNKMEWEVIPTLSFSIESSSTFTVPKGVKKIDVFCVGGGGAGSIMGRTASPFTSFSVAAGCGGYTTTLYTIQITLA